MTFDERLVLYNEVCGFVQKRSGESLLDAAWRRVKYSAS